MSSRLANRLQRLATTAPSLTPASPSPSRSSPSSSGVRVLDEMTSLFAPSSPRPSPKVVVEEAEVEVETPKSSNVLDALRAKMDAILAREKKKAEPPRVDVFDLPFCEEQMIEGVLHSRMVRHGGEHRIGRIPVAPARRADRELLALLALDPRLAGCDPSRALYLDTETTGLGPGAGTVAFLVGLSWFDLSSETTPALVVEQLLVRRLGEELPVLARLEERLRWASMLVTFNGKSFDMPVLRTRFVMNQRQMPPEPPHLDLLHVARRIHKARAIGATLGTFEREVLGFVRENDVPSGEVSACYLHFLRTGDPRALMGVVDHNAWDVVSMAALVGLYGEPLDGTSLEATDLVGVARTLKRAGDKDRAYEVANTAVEQGAGEAATRARAEIAKARGDKAQALADFESLSATIDDPKIRLELAKLYEHHKKDVSRALAITEQGTSEPNPQSTKREARLRKKLTTQLSIKNQ